MRELRRPSKNAKGATCTTFFGHLYLCQGDGSPDTRWNTCHTMRGAATKSVPSRGLDLSPGNRRRRRVPHGLGGVGWAAGRRGVGPLVTVNVRPEVSPRLSRTPPLHQVAQGALCQAIGLPCPSTHSSGSCVEFTGIHWKRYMCVRRTVPLITFCVGSSPHAIPIARMALEKRMGMPSLLFAWSCIFGSGRPNLPNAEVFWYESGVARDRSVAGHRCLPSCVRRTVPLSHTSWCR